MGRSSAPNSLQINVHNLDNIQIEDSFVPQVPEGIDPPSGIPAATLGAGAQMYNVYTVLNAKGVTIPGGSSSTVGVVGGFLQGGGHGILGYKAGMASDNALEFTVVTANVSS
jgi:FAD/FMN-containing dehydrogenase